MADSAKLMKRGTLKKGGKISVASSYFNEKGRKDPYFGIVESNALQIRMTKYSFDGTKMGKKVGFL